MSFAQDTSDMCKLLQNSFNVHNFFKKYVWRIMKQTGFLEMPGPDTWSKLTVSCMWREANKGKEEVTKVFLSPRTHSKKTDKSRPSKNVLRRTFKKWQQRQMTYCQKVTPPVWKKKITWRFSLYFIYSFLRNGSVLVLPGLFRNQFPKAAVATCVNDKFTTPHSFLPNVKRYESYCNSLMH